MYKARIALENYARPRVAFQFTHGDQIISLAREWEKKKGKQKHKKNNSNTAIKCAVCVEEVATAKLVSLFISQIALTRQRWSSSIFSFYLLPPSDEQKKIVWLKIPLSSAVVAIAERREREGSGEKSESE